MRKTTMIVATLGLLVAGIGTAMADQMPPGMNDPAAQNRQAKPKPKPRPPARHQQGSAHSPGARKMTPQPSPSPSSTPSAMPMNSGGCC